MPSSNSSQQANKKLKRGRIIDPAALVSHGNLDPKLIGFATWCLANKVNL